MRTSLSVTSQLALTHPFCITCFVCPPSPLLLHFPCPSLRMVVLLRRMWCS